MIRLAVWPSNCSRRVRVSGIWVGTDRARGIAVKSPRRETDDVRCIMRFVWLRCLAGLSS